ncbi:MAG: hypothetical protein HC767_00005 [Akkermansiaceae bacterium]|nr:hypothetical protein [Akkermansiaceae bacterium]
MLRFPTRSLHRQSSGPTVSLYCSDEEIEVVDGTSAEAQKEADAVEAELDELTRLSREQQEFPGHAAWNVAEDTTVLPPNMDDEDMLRDMPQHPFSLAKAAVVGLEARVGLRTEALNTRTDRPGALGSPERVKELRKKPPGLALATRIEQLCAVDVPEDQHLLELASVLGISLPEHQLNGSLVSMYVPSLVSMYVPCCSVSAVLYPLLHLSRPYVCLVIDFFLPTPTLELRSLGKLFFEPQHILGCAVFSHELRAL